MEAITDHQPPTVLVELVLELLDVDGDLGLSAAANICRAPSRTISSRIDPPAGSLDASTSWTTLSMSAPSQTSAPT
jgi:hypothetical protein